MNIVIWLYRLGGGGAERVTTDLAAAFARKNHQVTILTHSNDNPYAENLPPQVAILNLGKSLTKFMRPRTLFCLWGLVTFLKSEKPDVVFTTGALHSILLLILSKMFKFSGKIVIRETNTISVQAKKKINITDQVGFFFARFLYRLADNIIAPSSGVKLDLEKNIPQLESKVHLIYNPVNSIQIKQKSLEPLNNRKLKDKKFILAAGRLVPQKGYSLLIKAWAPLCTDNNIDLVILGEGPEREKLLSLANELGVSNNLHLQGFDPNPFRYMARAEMFVLSSFYEGLPNVLLQAMACGCPVIATDCPSGPREILQNGKLGTLVPINNIENLRQAISDYLKTPPQTHWDKIQKIYDHDHIADQYLGVFSSSNPDLTAPTKESISA